MSRVALLFPRCRYPTGDMPMGVGYIASELLKISGTHVDIIDTTFVKHPLDYISQIFSKSRYDVVGFSVMTSMIKDSFEMARVIKNIAPDTKIIFGGPHPTVAPDSVLSDDSVDAVCIGEGEHTMRDLLIANLKFEGVEGLWFKGNGGIIKNPVRKPINNLDELEFPNRDLMDTRRYFREWFQLDSVSPSLTGNNIIASRGCPYQCSYCQPTLSKIFGKKIRKRSPENVVEELEILKKKYQIRAFMFQDDTLIIDKNWVFNLCDEMIRKKIDLTWGCNIRVNLADRDLFQKMKDAGLRKVNMGIESGSQRILDGIYDKKITIDQIKSAVKTLKELDLKLQGYFMLGAPTETEEEIISTIKFAKNLDIDEATFSITTPLPHTYLYNMSKDLIGQEYDAFDYYKRPVYNDSKITLPPSRISFLKKRAFLEFYFSRKRLLPTLKSLLSPKTYSKLRRF